MIYFFKSLAQSLADYGTALRFIFKHRLAWFFLVPIGLNILLIWLGYWGFIEFVKDLQNISIEATHLDNAVFWGSDILRSLLAGVTSLLFSILLLVFFAYAGGYIILAILSPFLAYLSEKAEKILTGKDYPFSIQQLMRDVVRGVLIVLRNTLYESLFGFILFILSFIPPIGLITPIILFFISAYYYGFSFVDYVLERRRLNTKSSMSFAKNHKGLVIGNGIPFTLVLLIPFVGLLLSGFFAIIATVSAVITLNHNHNKN